MALKDDILYKWTITPEGQPISNDFPYIQYVETVGDYAVPELTSSITAFAPVTITSTTTGNPPGYMTDYVIKWNLVNDVLNQQLYNFFSTMTSSLANWKFYSLSIDDAYENFLSGTYTLVVSASCTIFDPKYTISSSSI